MDHFEIFEPLTGASPVMGLDLRLNMDYLQLEWNANGCFRRSADLREFFRPLRGKEFFLS